MNATAQFVLTALLFGALFGSGAGAQQASDSLAPEITTPAIRKPMVKAREFMVAAGHPDAAKAGHDILAKGGNAIDAMVAVQLVLGLVEPQSSGLGGGAFLLVHDAAEGKLHSYDGRETAPAGVKPDLFLDETGKPLEFLRAVIGGRSVGVPGTVALLELAHKKHGKLPWAELFEPAIRLAENGFGVSERLNASIADSAENLFRFTATRSYFLSEEAAPLFPGTIVKNAAYADTLRLVASGGAQAFYQGAIAGDIVAAVRYAPENPGALAGEDLANYKAIERDPVCIDYRAHNICGMGPPSSGAIAIGQILAMLEPYDLARLGPGNPQSWRLIGDATRLAFADRGKYVADPDFVKIPKGMLDRAYLAQRARLLAGARMLAPESVIPGEPPSDHSLIRGQGWAPELPSTSHFSIADKQGNVVSMTTTIENAFGSRLMVRGFLLNNELTDFSFLPEEKGAPVANRVEPGKRPRSSMSPMIVYKDAKPVLALGTSGGSRIIPLVATTLVALLDWGMEIDAALAMPHLANRFGPYEVEESAETAKLAPALEALGYSVRSGEFDSGLAIIRLVDGGIEGAADPRREGVATGR